MSSYATTNEYKNRKDPERAGQSLDDMGGDESDDKVLLPFLEDSSSFIDSFLQARYVVPLSASTLPNAVRRACIIIAHHDINIRRGGNPESEQADPEYDAIIEWLKDLRSGEVDLPNIAVKSASAAILESNDPVFNAPNFTAY